MGNFSEAMQNLVDELNISAVLRTDAVIEISDETERLISDIHDKNAEHTRETLEKLASDEKARVKATRQFINATRSEIKDFFDLCRIDREYSETERVQATGQFMGDLRSDNAERVEAAGQFIGNLRSDNAEGHRIWAERNSRGLEFSEEKSGKPRAKKKKAGKKY